MPVGVLAFLGLLFFLRIDIDLKSILEGLHAIDWIGLVLIVGATLMLLLGLEFGGSQHPWAVATVICLIIFGIVTAIIFGLNEWRFAHTPIIPISTFSNWYNFTVLVISSCHATVFIGGCLYLPVYFQNVPLTSSLMSGVYLLPLVVALCWCSRILHAQHQPLSQSHRSGHTLHHTRIRPLHRPETIHILASNRNLPTHRRPRNRTKLSSNPYRATSKHKTRRTSPRNRNILIRTTTRSLGVGGNRLSGLWARSQHKNREYGEGIRAADRDGNCGHVYSSGGDY